MRTSRTERRRRARRRRLGTVRASVARLAGAAGGESGLGIVEVLVAMVVLVVGILGMMMTFSDSQKLQLVSERSTTMAHIAQREIERIEGIPYAQIALTSAPTSSTDPQNPDYYVSGSSFEYSRQAGVSEPLDINTTDGTIVPVQSWSEGSFTGDIYDFITWSTDPYCSPGCPSSNDYKRITVAVTMSGELAPGPVWISSLIANPNSTPIDGTVNGTSGNPVTSGSATCTNSSGQPVACISPIDLGSANTFYLHDCAATNSSCGAPSGNGTTQQTVGVASGEPCTTSQTNGMNSAYNSGCPMPDLMDANPPAGTDTTPLYQYSTDLGTTGYIGGRLLEPLCSSSSPCGTGQTSDCNANTLYSSSLTPPQNQFWVSPPLSSSLTLTGAGGLSMYTQTQSGVPAVVSFCLEIYEVPPSGGVSGSLADLLAWPPVALGGVGYVPATDPANGSNWPTSPGQVAYTFNFLGSNGPVTVPAGDRIGVRVWMLANVNAAIALIYDNPLYPSEIQLNSQ
jgi:Tfp pilus assembly protein PilV